MSFRRLPTEIDGVVLLEPDVHGDERGFFVETFRAEAMNQLGVDVDGDGTGQPDVVRLGRREVGEQLGVDATALGPASSS